MADDEKIKPLDKRRLKEVNSWKRLLQVNPAIANEQIEAAIKRCQQSKLFHWTDINRFYTQMQNGSATPADFDKGRFGKMTRA